MNNRIRVRFAPSPTGYLHVGGLRSALYDYLFAKKNKGVLILKIEDTDQKRYIKGAVEHLIRSLKWSGLDWDEGVFAEGVIENKKTAVVHSERYPNILEVGNYGPYVQSEKLEVYKEYAGKLVKNGHAYFCFCTHTRLEQLKKDQIVKKQAPMYDRHCLGLTTDEVKNNLESGNPYVIRLKIEKDKIIEIDDIVRGKVRFNTNVIDDQILLKSDGYPTYHLASVIDDHQMEISHVIRGEEWLSSVPKHVLLYQYFGWDMPKFAHLPLLVNPDRSKLSKRQQDVALEEYMRKGYLKEAIINFVALLGWNPGKGETQEIFTLSELIEKFDINKVHKASAVFDTKKLDWINSQYIKKLSINELYELTLPFLEKKSFYAELPSPLIPLPEGEGEYRNRGSEEYLKKVLTIEQERLVNLAGVGESHKFFFREPVYEKELLRWEKMSDDELKNNLEKAKTILEKISDTDWTKENLEETLLKEAGDKRGELLWPLRAALTGEKKSPPPGEVAWVLGKEETIKRIKEALKK